MKFSHACENRSRGGVFSWADPPEDQMAALAVTDDDGVECSTGLAQTTPILQQQITPLAQS